MLFIAPVGRRLVCDKVQQTVQVVITRDYRAVIDQIFVDNRDFFYIHCLNSTQAFVRQTFNVQQVCHDVGRRVVASTVYTSFNKSAMTSGVVW